MGKFTEIFILDNYYLGLMKNSGISTFVMLSILIFGLGSCIPKGIKDEMNQQLSVGMKMFADQDFKNAIANIELHKLRNGSYPESLKDLKFLSGMGSTMFTNVEYFKLDSGYEINLKASFPTIENKQTSVELEKYPKEFWQGLGCIRSNLK